MVIAGGSGFLGRSVSNYFTQRGYRVTILTRCPRGNSHVFWDGKNLGSWVSSLEGCDVLVNLAGRSVNCRYTRDNRKQILRSRIDSTRVLREAILNCQAAPRIWFNSSTATIYNDTRGIAPANREYSINIGDDFSMGVAKKWEEEFFRVKLPGTTQMALRIAIVLGKLGGAFPVMKSIAKFGLCSPQGTGDQWISFLHELDFCRCIEHLSENPVSGVVNVCTPNPIQNVHFNGLLREQIRPLITIPQPAWLVHLGAILMRTQPELVLKSRKVHPRRLIQSGFEFQFPTAELAITNLLESDG